MAVTELLLTGVNLMLLGMGIVFFFLAVLVLVMNGMSSFAQRMSVAEPVTQPVSSTAKGSTSNNELIAVVTAAIKRYRAR
jgi:oxaloacetate decarboxylase gamma subunit